jgi:hypothetical protein
MRGIEITNMMITFLLVISLSFYFWLRSKWGQRWLDKL